MNQITIEVAYEEEAVPYINDPTGKNIWEFTEINIESLFVQRPVKVDVKIPVSLNDMTFIPDQDQSNYTTMKYLI